ncbi:MAG: toll/interleukin-1 receptor domain-containing protein [Planctomycetes bacterium]|nr:toll/interleukin-1 receptor domain-containing protein [Planctomycetota bacterium]
MAKRRIRARSDDYLVFVSHATQDKWLARTFCEKIEEHGARTFRDDRDLDGGDRIPDAIRKKIIQSNELLVVLTPESVARPWVLIEVGAAWGRRRDARIIAILCHVNFDRIPDIIDAKKAYNINDFDAYLESMKKQMARWRR